MYISFYDRRSNCLVHKFLRRVLFHCEENHRELLLNFDSIASFVYAINFFKFNDYRDRYEERFYVCDVDDFFKFESFIMYLTYS